MHQVELARNNLEKVLHHQIISQENDLIVTRKAEKTHRIKVINENDSIDFGGNALTGIDVLAIVGMDASVLYFKISTDPSSLHISNNVIVKK